MPNEEVPAQTTRLPSEDELRAYAREHKLPEVVQEKTGRPRRLRWRDPAVIAHVTALVTAIAALAASCEGPARGEAKTDKVYDTLRDRVEQQSGVLKQNGDDLRDLRAWLKGYFAATGVRIPDPAGGGKSQHVALAIEPVLSPIAPPSASQPVRVLTPLPMPKEAPIRPELPANADSL
jgi:hypothetical protein